MLIRRLFTCFSVLSGVTLGLVVPVVHAQAVSALLEQLQSNVDTVRSAGFRRLTRRATSEGFPLCSPRASAELKRGLIRGLEKENALIYSGGRSFTEAEGDYHGDLIGCVAALRDPAAIPALMLAIDTGGGATNGLIALGDTAVPQIIRLLQTSTARTTARHAAALSLGGMLSPKASPPLSAARVATIRAVLLADVADGDPFVRSASITSLRWFTDPEVHRAIQAAATSDTGTRIGAQRRYLVREAAHAWLRQDSLRSRRPE